LKNLLILIERNSGGIEMNIKRLLFSILVFLFILNQANTFAQGPGEAYYPETANGARFIFPTGHRLQWRNPDSTVYNVVYFSDDSNLVASLDPTTILYDGSHLTVYHNVNLDSVEPLQWEHYYYWRVVEFYNSISVESPVWSFSMMADWWCNYEIFFDDFSSGLQNWTVINDGGNCVWETIELLSRPYTMPPTASGNVFAADADLCGSGTVTNTTAVTGPFYASNSADVILEFDNDWQAISPEDFAYVDVSTDGGSTWINILTFDVVDVRNSHELHLMNVVKGKNFLIRFVSVQPGWDWWWAIDNVHIQQLCDLTQFEPPHNLKLITILQPSTSVEMNWEKGQFSFGFQIYRKDGLPTDTNSYVKIGEVGSNTTNFIDAEVQTNKIYTYFIHGLPYLEGGKSNEATAYVADEYVPVELLSFTSSTVDNDITLRWTTATEINNLGFEIEREQVFSPQSSVNNGEWQTIGFIPGHGTTSEKQSYSFKDENLISGKYQYRLKQIDFDGSFEYSNTIEVEITAPLEFSLEQNYPNPFNPTTKIRYTIPSVILSSSKDDKDGVTLRRAQSDIKVSLKVYDVLGNEVATLVNEPQQPGTYEVAFNVGQAINLSSGVYYYQLKTGEFVQTRKMLLLK
jgi:hypothetical protein